MRAKGRISGVSFDEGIDGYLNTASGAFCATLIVLVEGAGESVLALEGCLRFWALDVSDVIAAAIFPIVGGVVACTARFCGRSAVDMPDPGRRYTGFCPLDSPFRQPRPGPGAPRVLSPFLRLADGRASSSSRERVAATAEMEPGAGGKRRWDLAFLFLLVSVLFKLVSGEPSAAMESSANSSSDAASPCKDTSAGDSGATSASGWDVEDDGDASLGVDEEWALCADGTRSRTLKAVMSSGNAAATDILPGHVKWRTRNRAMV